MSEQEQEKQFMEPLDLTREGFKPFRGFIARLQTVLSTQDPALIEEHLELVRIAPDDMFDAEHFGNPAIFSLLMYGTSGVNALYRLASEDSLMAGHTVGQAIVAAAIGDADYVQAMVWLSHRYLEREVFTGLIAKVRSASADPGVSHEAKRALSSLFRFYLTDSSRRSELGMILGHITFPFTFKKGEQHALATELVWELMATATLNISDELCNQAELLVQQNLQEREYQEFFENHPALLDPLASSVIPLQPLGEMWRTDFVIRRLDNEYIFVEIEKPQDLLFTTYPHPSANLSHAVGQVLNWFAWVEDNIAYAQSHGFPDIHSPRGLIVIGRDESLDDGARRILKTLNDLVGHRLTICTYDDVIRNARNIVRNLTSKENGASSKQPNQQA